MKRTIIAVVVSLMAVLAGGFLSKTWAQAPQAQQEVQQGPADLVFKVSSLKGTYIEMATQISKACSTPSLQVSTSDGQLALYNDLITNKANVGFLTAPILFGKKDIEKDTNVSRIVVVMPMYTAEMHIIALRANAQLNHFSDVGNKRVGVYGGAAITSRIVMGQGQLRPSAMTDYKSEDAVLTAVQKGEIDVAFIEAGQPTKWAQELNGNVFKLLDFDRPDLLGRNGFVSASLSSYKNLSPTAVPTLGTKVYLVSQNYTGEKKVHDISLLKNCITKNLQTLREDTGNHPKWYEVKPGEKSDWPLFKTVSLTPAAKKKSQ